VVNIAKKLEYASPSMFEYSLGAYFLEINPRLQVEHTVTEETFATGSDGKAHKSPVYISSLSLFSVP